MTEAEVKQKYLSLIRNIVLFRVLSDEEFSYLLDLSSITFQKDGDLIVREGEVNQSLFAVVDGSVKVSVQENTGNQVYLCTIGSGEVFGEAGMFLKLSRTANVLSCDSSIILRITRESMMSFIKRFPTAGNKILMVVIHSLLRKLRGSNQELAFERQMDTCQDDIDAIVANLKEETG